MMRIGHGYDVHRLARGRDLILGGVRIDYELGLLGHSDADVLLHAICDALLGALGLGDIGRHFPDSDPAYAGIDSRQLLREVMGKSHAAGYQVGNLDATIICQRPKLAPYLPEMVERIAADCRVASGRINVKATTTEKLGFAGRGEGIAAHAVVLLQWDQSPQLGGNPVVMS
jgi:2-C-methyl-D-erythritol 2,4-cyclodiphosphate synthase